MPASVKPSWAKRLSVRSTELNPSSTLCRWITQLRAATRSSENRQQHSDAS